MRRLIVYVFIYLCVEAATLIALEIVDASQSWREAAMFTFGAFAGHIITEIRNEDLL